MTSQPDEAGILCADFYRGFSMYNPEEQAMHGDSSFGQSCKVWTEEAVNQEIALCERTLQRLEALDWSSLSASVKVDCNIVKSICEFQVHTLRDLHIHRTHVQQSAFMAATIQFLKLQADADINRLRDIMARVRNIPEALAQLELLYSTGLREGKSFDVDIAKWVVQSCQGFAMYFAKELPAQVGSDCVLRGRELDNFIYWSQLAGVAYEAHAKFIDRNIVPVAAEAYAIGTTEYMWLMRNMGINEPLAELVAMAEEELKSVHQRMLACAARIRQGQVRLEDIGPLLAHLRRQQPQTLDECLRSYNEMTRNLRAFIKSEGLLNGVDEIRVLVAPTAPGDHVETARNLPSPLFCRGVALFLVSPDTSEHAVVDLGWVCAHEGIPGHAAQSHKWSTLFGAALAPVRFLNVSDDVCFVRRDWSRMLGIEGWALYCEELVRTHGFYARAPEQELASLTGQALRALRVIVDIQLHTGGITKAQAAERLIKDAFLGPASARAQVERYCRLPTQAATYLLGRKQLDRLKATYRSRVGEATYSDANFHEWWISLGPVTPAEAETMLPQPK